MDIKPDIQWIQSSSGQTSCHVNDGKLNFKQSLIGVLNYTENGWRIVLENGADITPEEGCPSLARARMCLADYARKNSKAPVDRSIPRVAQAGRV